MIKAKRLILRNWNSNDSASLYKYANDPDIGPVCGWPPHKSIEESLIAIKTILNGKECYAITKKDDNIAIGAIELRFNGHTDMTDKDDECELGFWLGKPFWGNGYMKEAVVALLQHAFIDLKMKAVWCGYYDGNQRSKRVQEKIGFRYHHTDNDIFVSLMNEIRVRHVNVMTREMWSELYQNKQ